MRRRLFVNVLLAVLIAQGARASAPLQIINAWCRATAPGVSVGVAYFEIVNPGAADTLTSIESPAAARVEMHVTTTAGGMAQMRRAESVAIPAAGRIVFGPNGLHAMLIDLKRPLQAGQRLTLVLVFQHAGRVRVDSLIRGVGNEDAAADSPSRYRFAVWPAHALSPDFGLVDFNGRRRSLGAYRGRLSVVFFGFVSCPDACPAELFKLALALKQMGRSSDHVQVLFVTLDPQRDTRSKLKRYVTAFDPRFMGLTGTTAEIGRAADNFHVQFARVGQGADYTIDHSTVTFLLDETGRLRLLGSVAASSADYAHDLTALLEEGRPHAALRASVAGVRE